MSEAMRFCDDDALRAAILAGLAPAEIAAQPAQVARDGAALILAPAKPLPAAARARLAAAGVAAAALPSGARTIRCWAEAVPAARAPVEARPPLVVLATPSRLIDLAGELLRLGCERFELCALEHGGGMIRAIDPPTYVLVRAEDREDGLAAYVPARVGDETVWIERGAAHPLASTLRAPDRALLFVPGPPPRRATARAIGRPATDADAASTEVGSLR
jgi:hypothetical protein